VVAVVAVALAASVAVAAAGGHKVSPIDQLKHKVAALQAQNKRLTDTYTPQGIARQLAKTKAALDKYQSVAVAKAAGYVESSPCAFSLAGAGEESSHAGGMGVHFTNAAYLKPGPLDPAKPPVLVYAPAPGGALQLVAAEYFKPDADQNVQTDGDRPSIFGRAFDGPMLGHAPGMPIHYDLHVWLWKHNPSGMFAPWNPDVSCSS
jgi:hypothetical protein